MKKMMVLGKEESMENQIDKYTIGIYILYMVYIYVEVKVSVCVCVCVCVCVWMNVNIGSILKYICNCPSIYFL